ncbi:MAG: transglutaminaseTgpA domain-containing protein [Bryobacteraceae bacterium]
MQPGAPSLERLFQWSILGMLGCSYLSILGSGALDLPSLALAGCAIAARAMGTAGLARFQVPDRLANVLTLAYLAFFPIDYLFISGEFLPATIHLVFFLASLIILRAASSRDFFFIKLSSLSLLLAASVLSAGLSFLVWLIAFLVFAIGAQISGEIRTNLEKKPRAVARGWTRGAGRRLAVLSGFVFAGVALLAGGFFFILPRTAEAALRHFTPERFRLPGFSNEVRLGQIGEIRLTSTPVLHARLETDKPLSLKWRGSALGEFDGKRWFNAPEEGRRMISDQGRLRLVPYTQTWRRGLRITGEVQLKNATGDALFFPGSPEVVLIDTGQVIRTSVDGYRMPRGMSRGLRYQFYSVLDTPDPSPYPGALALAAESRALYLRTPNLDPRVAQLARTTTSGARSDLVRARLIEEHLRSRYGYTMELLEREVPDPISHFLFTRKKGHCEYFASAMALMLRSIGIPSRIATGFQSGVFNPISGWYLVRASDAHSWVEAFLEGYGWVTFDPTPPDPALAGTGVFSRVAMYMDAAEVFWQEWIVSYDLERQVLLADRMGQSSRAFTINWAYRWDDVKARGLAIAREIAAWWKIALAAVIWSVAIYFTWPVLVRRWQWFHRDRRLRQGRAEASDATLLYERMLATLGSRGVRKPGWMTPYEFARTVNQPLVTELTGAYHDLRYGCRPAAAAKMVELLGELDRRR